MGYYINPKTESKEAFIYREGEKIEFQDVIDASFDEDNMIVCLVDNGAFTAGLICYCEAELEYIQRTIMTETRPITFWKIEAKKLQTFL